MPRRSELTLSGRAVDGLSVEGTDRIFWDRELPGFGVRVYPSGRKVYVVQSRGRRAPRRVGGSIGADIGANTGASKDSP